MKEESDQETIAESQAENITPNKVDPVKMWFQTKDCL